MSDTLSNSDERMEKYRALTNKQVDELAVHALDLIVKAVQSIDYLTICKTKPEGMSEVQCLAIHDMLMHRETEAYLRALL